MSGLSAFFEENAIQIENTKFVASRRFKDENGQPMEWELQAITSAEDDGLRRDCTKLELLPGKTDAYAPTLDYNKYLEKLAASTTAYPNLYNAELQDSYGVKTPEELLHKLLALPGEYRDYLQKVQEVNGFIALDKQVAAAKNSSSQETPKLT